MWMEIGADVNGFLAAQARRTASEFGRSLAGSLPVVEWGDEAEYRAATAEFPATIVVSRDEPDWWRIRYQIAHEIFHWLCTPPRTFHWTHELFAVETAVRAMEELGEHDYAQRVMGTLTREAELLSLGAMLTSPFRDRYPDGLYGRAWLTGRRLQDAIGWERLKPLASCFDEEGRPAVGRWIESLGAEERQAVVAVLGEPVADWV